MKNKNVELLNDVIADRLNAVLEGAEEDSKAFDEAMKAIDRMIEIQKNNISNDKNEIDKEKVEVEKDRVDVEIRKDETLKNKIETESLIEKKKINKEIIMKAVEIGAIAIAAPLIDYGCKKAFAKILCEFEKDYTFTTTAGRSLSSLFRFK